MTQQHSQPQTNKQNQSSSQCASVCQFLPPTSPFHPNFVLENVHRVFIWELVWENQKKK